MGYLLRGLRVASYLATALGIILIFGAIINNATFFYGIRFLFLGVVGIGATSLLRDSFLEGAEEEEYHSLLPTPQLKTPPLPQPKTQHLPQQKTPKLPQVNIPKLTVDDLIESVPRYIFGCIGVVVASVSGFIGAVVGSFVIGVIFDTQAGYNETHWGYVWFVLLLFGYPLVGAFFGALGGILIFFIFKRIGDNMLLSAVGFIASSYAGFFIGVLVGIPPFIVLNALGCC